MAVTITLASSGPYTGTGAVGQEFPVTFQSDTEAGIQVLLDGAAVNPALYDFEREDDGTGTVTATLDGSVMIVSNPTFEQPHEFQQFGPYFPSDVNAPLDKSAIRDIFLKDRTDRTILMPPGTPGLVLSPNDVNGLIGVDADGDMVFLDASDFTGSPGGNVLATGPFSAIANQTIPSGTTRIRTTAYEIPGVPYQALGAAFYRLWTGDALHADGEGFWWTEDLGGNVWVLDWEQVVYPEMVGAVGDAIKTATTLTGTDDLVAWRQWTDYLTWNGGGKAACRSTASYRLGDHAAGTTWRWGESVYETTMVRRDGKLVRGSFHDSADDTIRPARLLCTEGLHIDGNGARVYSDGNFSLTVADYGTLSPNSPLVNAHSVFLLWKNQNILIENLDMDGGWSMSSTNHGPTGGGSRISHCIRAVGGWGTIRNCFMRDWSMDAFVCIHRMASTLDGIALTNLERFVEPANNNGSDPDVEYYPTGASGPWKLESCTFENCGRVALAPIGTFGWTTSHCNYLYTCRNKSPYPKWAVGDPTGGEDLYQIPGVNPGYAVDYEPDNNRALTVTQVYERSPIVIGCKGWMGVAGDHRMTRVQNSFLAAGVDTAENTLQVSGTTRMFTDADIDIESDTVELVGHGFATAAAVLVLADDTFPAPLDGVTTYYVIDIDDDHFRFAASASDANNGIAINLTSVGVGTFYISGAATCSLPRCIEGQINQAVRIFTDGTYPAGLEPYTDYWVSKPNTVAANLLGKVIRLHANEADAIAQVNPIDITTQGVGTFYIAVYDSIACIDEVKVEGGYVQIDPEDNPNGGVFVITGNCPNVIIDNVHFRFNHPLVNFGMLGLAKGGRLIVKNSRIESTRRIIGSPTSKGVKTAALPGAVDTGTDVMTITDFSKPDDVNAPGKFGFDPVYFSEAAGDYPKPFIPNRKFFATRLTKDTLKLSKTLQDAIDGNYIDIVSAGTGTLTIYRDFYHETVFKNIESEIIERNLHVPAANWDATDDIIFSPGHGIVGTEALHVFTDDTLPGGVTNSTTTYYGIRVDDDYFQLATSLGNAAAGVAMDITSTGAGTHHLVWSTLQNGTLPISCAGTAPVRIKNFSVKLPASCYPAGEASRLFGFLRQITELDGFTIESDIDGWQLHDMNLSRPRNIVDKTPELSFAWTGQLAGMKNIGGDHWRLTTTSLDAAAVGGAAAFGAGASAAVTISTGMSKLRTTDKLIRVEYPSAVADGLVHVDDRINTAAAGLIVKKHNTTGGGLGLPTGVYGVIVDRSAPAPMA